LPATLRCGNSCPSWNISANPRLCVGTPCTDRPSQPISPVAGSSPATARSNVDIPDPPGPRSARTYPSATTRRIMVCEPVPGSMTTGSWSS
jgi:hypothetical protein